MIPLCSLVIMPEIKASSLWNNVRLDTMSRAKSLVPNVPSTIGAVKGLQSFSHTALKLKRSRAAPLARESQTAAVKRPQTQALSSAASCSV